MRMSKLITLSPLNVCDLCMLTISCLNHKYGPTDVVPTCRASAPAPGNQTKLKLEEGEVRGEEGWGEQGLRRSHREEEPFVLEIRELRRRRQVPSCHRTR